MVDIRFNLFRVYKIRNFEFLLCGTFAVWNFFAASMKVRDSGCRLYYVVVQKNSCKISMNTYILPKTRFHHRFFFLAIFQKFSESILFRTIPESDLWRSPFISTCNSNVFYQKHLSCNSECSHSKTTTTKKEKNPEKQNKTGNAEKKRKVRPD